jgi:L,D-transpeptidase ErfK/SrfK
MSRLGRVASIAIALVAAAATLLPGSAVRAGKWTEEDFARRVPITYSFISGNGDAERTVVGALATYTVEEGDTLLDVGRHFDLGYNEMIAANPGVDPWLPPPGEVVVIPAEYVLPESSTQGLVVNIPEMRLYYLHGGSRSGAGQMVTTYPVGLGRDDWQTPQGRFKVRGKTENPTWVIPESIRAEHIRDRNDARTFIAGGDPENPLGAYRLELTLPLYALHGSNMPWGVGMQVSHGCIRLYNEDIAALFREIRVGTPGEFLYQPVKVGARDGRIYVEVHPDIYDLTTNLAEEADRMLGRRGWSDRVDRERLRQALLDQSGLPVMISGERLLETVER